MAPPRTVALIGAMLAVAFAQSDADSNPKVWAAVAFVNHGESTPYLSQSQSPVLTPEGAQQMVRQGTAFRNRYLYNANGTTAPIQGISQDAIDNNQIGILSAADSNVAASAMAFLQGLYPPDNTAFLPSAGGPMLADNLITGGNSSYPLNGYQYPTIMTVSYSDSDIAAIDGSGPCLVDWQKQVLNDMGNNPKLVENAEKDGEFYQNLFSSPPLQGLLSLNQSIYYNAYEIYELVSYQFKHNETVHKGLGKDANKTLATLRRNALDIERARIGEMSAKSDNDTAVLHTIPGRTLARKIADELSGYVNHDDGSTPLSLMFGSSVSLSSFFAVGDLLTNDNLKNTPIGNLTQPGAALIFEVIGGNKDTKDMPGEEDLSVRFLYRASADTAEEFKVYSLFGSGFDGRTMPYNGFLQEMTSRGRTASEWCSICQLQDSNVPFCSSSTQGSDGSSSFSKSTMSPALGGIIGAIIMMAIFGIIGLILLFCGFRIKKEEKAGFRRGEKNRDRDVRVANNGVPQERVGSWEMRGGGGGESEGQNPRSLGAVTSEFNRTDAGRQTDEESVNNAAPVRARESV